MTVCDIVEARHSPSAIMQSAAEAMVCGAAGKDDCEKDRVHFEKR